MKTSEKAERDLEELFRDKYPRPVVKCHDTEVPHVEMCSAFDRSQLNEDPLRPTRWYVVRRERKLRATSREAWVQALEEAGFTPKSTQEALVAVKLLALGLGERIVTDRSELPPGVPPEQAEKVAAPVSRAVADGFEVVLWMLKYSPSWHGFPGDGPWLTPVSLRFSRGKVSAF